AAKANQRDFVAMKISLLQQSGERAFRLRQSIDRHAPACVNGEDKQNARAMLELLESQIARLDFHTRSTGHSRSALQLKRRGGSKRGVDGNSRVARAAICASNVTPASRL